MAEMNYQGNPNDTSMGFPILAAGQYLAAVTNSDVRPTKSGTGKYVSLEWTVLDGQNRNQKIFEIINFQNQNQQCQAIGRKTLNNVLAAFGITDLSDTSQLHNTPILLTIGVKRENGEDKNVVKNHEPRPVEMPPGSRTTAPANVGTMPWQEGEGDAESKDDSL